MMLSRPVRLRVGRPVSEVAAPGLLSTVAHLSDGRWHVAGTWRNVKWIYHGQLAHGEIRRSVCSGSLISAIGRFPDGTLAWFVKMPAQSAEFQSRRIIR